MSRALLERTRAFDNEITRKYLARSVLFWLAVRLLLSVFSLFVAIDPFDLSLFVSFQIVLLTVLLIFIEFQRRREFILLRNLEVSRKTVAVACGIPPLVGETLVQLAGVATR